MVWVTSAPERHRAWSYPLRRSLCAIVVASGDEVAISDVREETQALATIDVEAIVSLRGVESYLGVPVMVDGGLCLGSVCAYGDGIAPWTERQRVGLRHITEAVAAVLEPIAQGRDRDARRMRAGLERDMERLVAEHAAVRRVATIAAQTRETQPVFDAVVVEVSGLLDGAPVVLGQLRAGDIFPVAAAGGVIEERGAAMCGVWRDASGPVAACSAVVGDRGDRVAGAPITVGGVPWGVLLAGVDQARGGNPVEPLEEFTELLAIAIDNAQQRRRLSRWPRIDS